MLTSGMGPTSFCDQIVSLSCDAILFYFYLFHLTVAREYRPISTEGAVASHGSKQKQSKKQILHITGGKEKQTSINN